MSKKDDKKKKKPKDMASEMAPMAKKEKEAHKDHKKK